MHINLPLIVSDAKVKNYISETILQISLGVIDANEKCRQADIDVMVNPDMLIGENGAYYIPREDMKAIYPMERMAQNTEMSISVTATETEKNRWRRKIRYKNS